MRPEILFVVFMAKFPTLRMELSAESVHNKSVELKAEGRTDAPDVVPAQVGKIRDAQKIQCPIFLLKDY